MKTPTPQPPLTVPVYQILLTLSDRDLHGYAIIQDVRERTGGEVDLTASTLYAAVARMVKAELIVEVDGPSDVQADDPRRRYYRIEPSGLELLRLEAMRLERSAQMARDKNVIPAMAGSRSGGRRS